MHELMSQSRKDLSGAVIRHLLYAVIFMTLFAMTGTVAAQQPITVQVQPGAQQAPQTIQVAPGQVVQPVGQQMPQTGQLAPGLVPQPVVPQPTLPVYQPVPGQGVVQVFGEKTFVGTFRTEQMFGFNPNYQISIGDRITVRLWGAFSYEGILLVDPQGNIFIPNVGPVSVLGVKNSELNAVVGARVQTIYKSNIYVYASLESVQPVKVFVTGFVRTPGLYGGLSSNSVLYYIDKAGGIDPARGSFLDITVLRGDQVRKKINLYDFLLQGKLDLIQFADGDIVLVGSRQHTMTISGEVDNPYQFEFTEAKIPLLQALSYAKTKPGATHVSIIRRQGVEKTVEYHPIDKINDIMLFDGDSASVLADRYPGTISVRVEGAHSGAHSLILPYGVKMSEALDRIVPNPSSNMEAIQLFRKEVAVRQKEMLQVSLQALQNQVLTVTSATAEEAQLRAREAEMVLKFVEIAKTVEPKGQVILGSREIAKKTLLEDGDLIRIPEFTSLVMVHGEVLFPNAISYREEAEVDDYIELSGNYTQKADKSKILILHQNGIVEENASARVTPGDEIMVLPKVETKKLEIARAIFTIIYQIAIAARVVIGL